MQEMSHVGISLIIPFKDEIDNLPSLISSLENQSHANWELILVNDHSEDGSFELARSLIENSHLNAQLINSDSNGKKAALLTGVKSSTHPIIVTSDADCSYHPLWLINIANACESKQADLLILPVTIKRSKGWLNRFQQIDFAAVQLSGAAAALQGKAIMCNGANLACSKAAYLEAELQTRIASGDDMFLLEWMKQNNKKIDFIKTDKVLVETKGADTLKSFLHQRARWAAKAPHYKDKQIITIGIIVSSVNLVLIGSLMAGILAPTMWKIYGIVLFTKSICDYTLLKAGSNHYKFNISFLEVLFWQAIYPLYVLIVLVYPLFVKVIWKSRTI